MLQMKSSGKLLKKLVRLRDCDIRYLSNIREICFTIYNDFYNDIGKCEFEVCDVWLKLFFDEMIAFAKIAEKKTYEETTKRLATIVVTRKSKRVYAGLILQRPDTAFTEGAIRDNLGCHIAMGQMSDTAYKMCFGSDFSDVKNSRRELGSGLIYRQGMDTKPREFFAPFIEKGALNRE